MSGGNCFVCGGQTHAVPPNFHAKVACPRCLAKARLLPSGKTLTTILKSAQHGDLNTNGLSPLLNPVAIDAFRGWAGFAEGDYAIFGEEERCSDWFDFIVVHIDPGPRILELLRKEKLDPSDPVAVLRRLAAEYSERINQLALAWVTMKGASEVLAELGPIDSFETALAAGEALEKKPTKFEKEYAKDMVARLYRLADVDL